MNILASPASSIIVQQAMSSRRHGAVDLTTTDWIIILAFFVAFCILFTWLQINEARQNRQHLDELQAKKTRP